MWLRTVSNVHISNAKLLIAPWNLFLVLSNSKKKPLLDCYATQLCSTPCVTKGLNLNILKVLWGPVFVMSRFFGSKMQTRSCRYTEMQLQQSINHPKLYPYLTNNIQPELSAEVRSKNCTRRTVSLPHDPVRPSFNKWMSSRRIWSVMCQSNIAKCTTDPRVEFILSK